MISAPTCGWMRTFWNSSGVSGPGFDRMCSGTASLPMSCSSAAVLIAWISSADRPIALRQPDGVMLHAQDVRVGHLIFGVDGAGQCFDGREVQIRGFWTAAASSMRPM